VEAYDGPQIVGMDLHRRRSVLVRMAADGRKLATARITDSPARLTAEIRQAGVHPKVVLEACYGWSWAAGALAAAGAEVHLAHRLGVKACSCRRVKNDELDARDLADLLRMGRLPEARGRPGGDPRTPRDHQVPAQAGEAADPAGPPIRQARDAIIARRGPQARNIATVAAARTLLTYVYLRDARREGQVPGHPRRRAPGPVSRPGRGQRVIASVSGPARAAAAASD
jgi:Transposase